MKIMLFSRATLAAGALVALVAPAHAGGLAETPRAIAKEPAYKGQPQYCLVVLGVEAKTRVWVVRDGDTAYVDRNGNGDLTEAGEKVAGTAEVDDGEEMKVTTTEFELGDLPPVGGKKAYTGLMLRRFLVEPKVAGPGAATSESTSIALTLNEASSQSVAPKFASKAADAPLVHFDGPLSVRFPPTPTDEPAVLLMGVEGQELTVQIGTQGLGAGTWAPLGYEQVADDVKPVLEITFPPAKAGGAPLTAKFTLDDRC